MKVTDLKTYVVKNPTNRGQGEFTLVKVTTDNGIQGIGEAAWGSSSTRNSSKNICTRGWVASVVAANAQCSLRKETKGWY